MAYPITVTDLEGEHFEVTVTIIYKGRCRNKKLLIHTEDSRKFRHAQGKELLFIKKLSVKDHVIFYCEGSHQGKIFRMGMLMGRNPKENSQALEEFKKFTWSKGLLQENIFILKQKEPCVPEHY
uniref:Odorant-binding protein 2b-like n=2 Tax=Castor canadensis TaxID=51338 RepID=A0A8B7U4S0_CASCN|nr:odorant-binding protein 2b-like [Castor canadensis]